MEYYPGFSSPFFRLPPPPHHHHHHHPFLNPFNYSFAMNQEPTRRRRRRERMIDDSLVYDSPHDYNVSMRIQHHHHHHHHHHHFLNPYFHPHPYDHGFTMNQDRPSRRRRGRWVDNSLIFDSPDDYFNLQQQQQESSPSSSFVNVEYTIIILRMPDGLWVFHPEYYGISTGDTRSNSDSSSAEDDDDSLIARNLRKIRYDDAAAAVDLYGQKECSVCFDELVGKECGRMPCGHLFHHRCIYKWIKNHSRLCPICRRSIQD